MATVSITVNTTKDQTAFMKASQSSENMNGLINLLSGLSCGALVGNVYVSGSSTATTVRASATATLVSCATDTITVGKTTFTGTSTPTTSLHFETDGTDTADAAALAAAINAHADTSKLVYATSAAGVVTVTALAHGTIGNHIAFSETGSTITCTGSGYLTGGLGGVEAVPETVR